MVEITKPELENSEFRYNENEWELTGQIDVKQNGEVIHARGKERNRIRGDSGMFQFSLQDPPASLNPGNPGDFHIELERVEEQYYLVVTRNHTTNRYTLKSMNYT